MLNDSTSPECAVGNIFLIDGASHFVIIFARATTAWNGAQSRSPPPIGTKLEREYPAVDLFPRQDAKFIIRARSLTPDYFLIARQNRGGGEGEGGDDVPSHPVASRVLSREIEGSPLVCPLFFRRNGKVEKPPGIFWDFMKYFALYFAQEYE